MQITFCVMAPVPMSFSIVKKPTLKLLHKENIWVDNHKNSMTELDTSLLGWFCEAHYPHSCHRKKIEAEINSLLDVHFHENKSVLLPFANTFPTLYGWKGTKALKGIFETVKPKWKKCRTIHNWCYRLANTQEIPRLSRSHAPRTRPDSKRWQSNIR